MSQVDYLGKEIGRVDTKKLMDRVQKCAKCHGDLENAMKKGDDFVKFCNQCAEMDLLDWKTDPPGWRAKYTLSG